MNCTKRLKSRKVQRFFKKYWKKTMEEVIQEHGGLPKNFYRDFKDGFEKGFMDSCKTRTAPPFLLTIKPLKTLSKIQ
jgi:hypothetical protein